jgi:hypothetical protein
LVKTHGMKDLHMQVSTAERKEILRTQQLQWKLQQSLAP